MENKEGFLDATKIAEHSNPRFSEDKWDDRQQQRQDKVKVQLIIFN
jgi:hypothetical protein